MNPWPFCDRLRQAELTAANDLVTAFLDAFPLRPGHTLIIPRRHVADLFELTDAERAAL
jgi:diadenosine tetraphosphate (Ap4A) HIT family hydrolase